MLYIDKYIEASGANSRIKQEFIKIIDSMSELSQDPKTAAIQVKKTLLQKLNFKYRPFIFKAQDVLTQKKGNCLGLPVLVASILDYFGINSYFHLVLQYYKHFSNSLYKIYSPQYLLPFPANKHHKSLFLIHHLFQTAINKISLLSE